MEAIGIDPKMRDYCADLLVPYYKCRRDWYPWVAACKHELHEWKHCQYEESVILQYNYLINYLIINQLVCIYNK